MLTDNLKPRVMGGYLVLPTRGALAAVHRPTVRAAAIREVRELLHAELAALDDMLSDTGTELRFTHGLTWDNVGHHLGMTAQAAFTRVSKRASALRRTLPIRRRAADRAA